MRRIAFIGFTRTACELALRFADELAAGGDITSVDGPGRYADELDIEPYISHDAWTAEHFDEVDALVFVSACGIAVRSIAPYVKDKFTDPAVVSIDERGSFVVPLLSGHVGGANDLARELAGICGGQAVISTATDVQGQFAVDEWARKQDLFLVEREYAKEVSAALLEGKTVGIACDFEYTGTVPAGLDPAVQELGILISYDVSKRPFAHTLHLVPRNVVVGAGCRRDTDPEVFGRRVMAVLDEAHISPEAVRALASIDIKANEPALHQLAEKHKWDLRFFTADELSAVEGEFTPSEFVASTVGVDNVCERAAVCAGGELVVPKQPGDGVTVALAARQPDIAF